MTIIRREPKIALWEISDDTTLYLITFDGKMNILQSYCAALWLALAEKILEFGEYRRDEAEKLRDAARRREKLFIKVKYDLLPEGHGWQFLSKTPGYGVEYLENKEWQREQNRIACLNIERESCMPYIGSRSLVLWKSPYPDEAWTKPNETNSPPLVTALNGERT